MKAVILTSSIFYLLGLKMSQNIETTQKSQPDTNPTPVIQEQVDSKQEETPKEEEKTLYISPQQTPKTIESDSDLNSVIRKKSTHLVEKID